MAGFAGSHRQYDHVVASNVAVSMGDGVVLYVVLYRPALAK